MAAVSTPQDIETKSKQVISTLYGDVSDFRVNETFAMPEKGEREACKMYVEHQCVHS